VAENEEKDARQSAHKSGWKPSPADGKGDSSFPPPFSTATTDNPIVHNPAMSSSQPLSTPPVLTLRSGEPENLGNLTASARTSRTRVDLLPTSPPREITTAAPSIQDEEGNAAPVREPPREEATGEAVVSLTMLVLSGDRKKFTFHPDMTVGRVKEMIWSSWDAGMSPITPVPLGMSDGVILRLDKGRNTP
jgi:hypothetical protein